MTKRWLGISLVVWIVFAAQVASAAVTSSPTIVTAGSVPVGSSGNSAAATLTSDGGNVMVDLVLDPGCTGMFAFNDATMLNLNSTYNNVVVTFTAAARGTITCTVTVYPAGTTTGALGTFQVRGTGVAPQIGTTPATTLNLGSVRVNDLAATSTTTATLTVTNTSTDTGQVLTVDSIGFTDAASNSAPADFTVTAGPAFPANINPNNGTAQWTITFNPSAAGARNAVVNIASNDPLTPTKTLDITGSGTEAVIAVAPDLAFGTVTAGGAGTQQSTTVSNSTATNPGVLTITTASITQTSTWFSFDAGLGCTAGTTSCTFTDGVAPPGAAVPPTRNVPVRCAPPAAASGTQNATVTFTSDSDGGGDSTAMLTCTAGRPNIMINNTTLDFMSQFVNTSATAQTVTVMNTGNTNLTFTFARAGTNPGQFSAVTQSGCGDGGSLDLCTVAPGGSVDISVGFLPTSVGGKTATLVITSNDPDVGDSPINVTLAGTGIAPVATANPTSINFMDVEVGKSHAGVTLLVTNTGTANLTISNAAITAGAGEFSVTMGTTGSQTTVVAPSASAMWTLTCTPTSQGAKSGTFQVTSNSNAVAGSQLNVALSCNGLRGQLTITPTTHNFGGVREGDTRTQNFTLSNPGNIAVTNIDVAKDAKLLGFTITAPANFPIDLQPGTNTTITVQFAPANANDGCAVAMAGDCRFTFTGAWGTTPTMVSTFIVVTGDGLNATYDTSPSYPNPLDFGSIRYDQTATLPVSIINTGGSTIQIRSLTITPGTAMTGEFSVVNCTRNSVVIPCPTTAAPYNSSGMNDTIIVNVRCDPNNRVGMLDATLTVGSDLNTATPNRDVPLRCTSTTAELVLDPANMVLDFGPVDLDAVPVAVTRRITLTNSGAAPLNVGAATRAGAALARFGFTATNATVVNPGGSFDVDITYTPTMERTPAQPDTASITFPLTGWITGPSSMTIQISGYGADRHIGVGAAPTFPDTFKNPGDAAPVMPVTISNTGYAPLNISAVMLTNDPIWTLVNPEPVTIPATSSHDFLIRFAPLMAGKAPTGRLQIMNDDNGMPMVGIDLDGNGLTRDVSMGPRVIELGFTGIGIPIRLSELAPDEPFVVENADSVNSFRIARIEVDSIMGAEGTFEIVDRAGNAPTDLVLDPGGRQVFDITFTPEQVGDFEATATLYLDQDPTPQAQVTLRGRGLYVDVRGGGGCSTGRSHGGWLVLVVAVLLASRRRRAHAARHASLAMILIMTAVLGGTRTSAAQSSRNLNINVFEPTPATIGTTFQLQSAGVAADGDWVASALVTYANNALVLDTSQNEDAAVKNRTMLLLGGAYVFGGRFEAGARLPVLLQSGDPAGDPTMRFGVTPASGAALGDGTLHIKARLGNVDALGGALTYGATAALTVPTASDGEFAGTDLPTGRLLLLGSLSHRRLTTTLNVGGVVRENTQFASLNLGSGALWGAGATFRVLDRLWAGAEVFGELIPGGKTGAPPMGESVGDKQLLNTIEGLAGVHYIPARAMSLGVAIGRGVTSGPGTPAFRGLVTFSYAPNTPDLKPLRVPRPPQPPRDTDGDGVKDELDDCPNDVEDKDLFDDADGCPDPDNDNDGVIDGADTCPLDPEDKDRFQDDDGCPDPDNDGDGVADRKDRCPLAAEDKDAFQDGDGCPEADNDKDGIVDSADKCPNEAEVINGTDDNDGCPDKGNSLIIVSPDRLELLESIQFSGTRISKSSTNVLGQLAATLRAHPEILRVRLTAHVNPTRSAAADQKRSEDRAKAVREWLVDWGIDPLRLQSSGFGGEKPLVPANSKGAQEINDRVELIILERK